MTNRWRLWTNEAEDACFQMGLDALLLEDECAPPTLRFYTWQPDALSLGYFQRFTDISATAAIDSIVRRQTGGGAIHHADELTFALATTLDDPLYRGVVADSYARIHTALAEAFRPLGVDATLRGEASCASDASGTGMCFHESTPLDLVWGQRKGVGSAQRRTKRRVLHHGSIKLGHTEHEAGVATLRAGSPDVRPEEVIAQVTRAFERAFELSFEPGEPTPEDRARARERGRAFADPKFVHRR